MLKGRFMFGLLVGIGTGVLTAIVIYRLRLFENLNMIEVWCVVLAPLVTSEIAKALMARIISKKDREAENA